MKKLLIPFILLCVIVLSSCTSVRVTTDYDTKVDFNKYKTFAFYKTGIDKAKISDLDKKRILRAIEAELLAKGFTKSENPDMLVSIFTKSRERINANQNYGVGWGYGFGWGWGWGWNPWIYGGMNDVNISQYTEGTLFIDFIDKREKELIWQGIGTGVLTNQSVEKKEARIKELVKEMINEYPPNQQKQ